MEDEVVRPMTNQEMAAVLSNIATLLRAAGNENPFRTAAYERCARALMGLEHSAAETLHAEKHVPFGRRQRIGKRLQAKIREMAESGSLEQYVALLRELPPPIAALMEVPGIGPKRAAGVHQALGIASAADLVRAARDGRLRRVAGFGDKRVADIARASMPDQPGPAGPVAGEQQPAPLQGSLFDLPRAAA